MTYYADTSWWVGFRYHADVNRQAAIGLFDRDPAARVFWTPWPRLEIFNTFHQMARRSIISRGEARQAIRQFENEVRLGYWPHREFKWPNAVRRACQLAEQHGASFTIAGFDLFHVAIALTIRAGFFLTFDKEQRAFAQVAGLRVDSARSRK